MKYPSPASIARNMLKEAEINGCPGAYSAIGHSTDNISILHQQARCINLSWALVRMRHVRHGSVVGIVGGGFSGLTLAVSLALQRRCIVYIYEKNEKLLQRFRQSPYRFISTNLNSRDLPPRYRPQIARPIYEPPIFEWSEGTASEVAHRWLREFQIYYRHLPIFLNMSSTVTGCRHDSAVNNVKLQVIMGTHPPRQDPVDVAIMAVGFGNEQNPKKIDDWSYWGSGSSLQYRPGRRSTKKERVLISGCGDSGLVELMHYVFRDFEHRHINGFYPAGAGVESYVQPTLEQSRYYSIRYSPEIDNFDRKVISELCWFYFGKYLRDRNPTFVRESAKGLKGKAMIVHELYEKIYTDLAKLLRRYGIDATSMFESSSEFDRLEKQIRSFTREQQFAIRDAIDPSIRTLASTELDLKIGGLRLNRYFDLKAYRKRLLDRFEVWMNDSTPTAYTEKLSPVNLIFLKLCQSVEDVRFVSGKLESVTPRGGGYQARFEHGQTMTFERVATRIGTRHDESTQRMIGLGPRKMHFGDWLLEAAMAEKSSIDDSGQTRVQRFDVAREAVATASAKFALRPMRRRDKNTTVAKPLYLGRLALPDPKLWGDDPILADAENWLRARLRQGHPVAFSRSDGIDL